MNSLRIGCDRLITWSITSGGEPYDLTGRNIRLKVSTSSTQFFVSPDDFSIDGNRIIWLFRGKDQKYLGPYTLTYIENQGTDNMLTFDRCHIFNLVAWSCQESRSASEDMEISNIDLASDIVALGVKLLPGQHAHITYQELVSLRNSSRLLPGIFYRITDYMTTTVQASTRSAGHQFDVVVLALSENTLSERAYAVLHEGDTYFTDAGANLSAWQIWYCLDNDSERFAWTDAENGKGVIYRMIDEWDNDLPYDFKNIQFRENNGLYRYTFADAQDIRGGCRRNSLKPSSQLHKIIFGYYCYGNRFGDGCNYIRFGSGCNYNIVGNGCHDISFGDDCCGNRFGDGCYNNSLPRSCSYNNFGNSCAKIRFVGYLAGSVAPYAQFNTFGDGCTVDMYNNATASSEQQIQNYRIAKGTTGVVEVIRGLAYETTVAVNSSGEVKQFCLADIIL